MPAPRSSTSQTQFSSVMARIVRGRPSQRIKTKKSFLSLSRSPRGVVTGVGTADWGDPELVLMRRPLVDMQLCLLLCYLGASHRDPGGVIMPAGQKGQRPNPSTAPLDHLHSRTCTLAFICTHTKVPRFLNNFAPHHDWSLGLHWSIGELQLFEVDISNQPLLFPR